MNSVIQNAKIIEISNINEFIIEDTDTNLQYYVLLPINIPDKTKNKTEANKYYYAKLMLKKFLKSCDYKCAIYFDENIPDIIVSQNITSKFEVRHSLTEWLTMERLACYDDTNIDDIEFNYNVSVK